MYIFYGWDDNNSCRVPVTILVKIKNLSHSDVGFDEGADEPEAMEDGLYDTLRLDWQSNVKMCVLIADQPPHGLCHRDHQHDNYPNGTKWKHDKKICQRKINANFGTKFWYIYWME